MPARQVRVSPRQFLHELALRVKELHRAPHVPLGRVHSVALSLMLPEKFLEKLMMTLTTQPWKRAKMRRVFPGLLLRPKLVRLDMNMLW